MRRSMACALIMTGLLWLGPMTVAALAQDGTAESKPAKDPVFVQWLIPGDLGDEVIGEYWSRAKADELEAADYVDLGTMLFYRGYPKDAVRMYREALDRDKGLYEAWFRIGLVQHRAMEYEDARAAYKKCLKLLKGHGWCNFYLGLLEEQTHHPSKALEYYERAYKVAPELSDPKINPDVLYSKLQLGAAVRQQDSERFTDTVPMPYLDPGEVQATRALFEPTPTPTPTPPPTSTPTPIPSARSRTINREPPAASTVGGTGAGTATGGSSSGGRVRPRPSRAEPTPSAEDAGADTPYGVRRPKSEPDSGDSGAAAGAYGSGARNVSPEATLRPWWRTMPEWILVFV